MLSFLKQNWAWVVIPAVVFLALIVVLLLTSEEGASPFLYGN